MPNPLEQLPHNFEVEAALLGALLSDNKAYRQVSTILEPHYFADSANASIYEAIANLMEQGRVADPLVLGKYFDADELKHVGGNKYLMDLLAATVSIAAATDYAKQIRDMWLRRALVVVGRDLVDDANKYELEDDALDLVQRYGAILNGLPLGVADDNTVTFDAAVGDTIKLAEAARLKDRSVIGLSTGFHKLDSLIGGMRRGQVVIIAGRPSMGKTTVAMNIARRSALAGRRTLLFSHEMSRDEIVLLLLAAESKVPAVDVMAGRIKAGQMEYLKAAREKLAGLNLLINDSTGLYVDQIRAIADRERAELVIVDYLQLLAGDTPGQRQQHEVQRVTAISRRLKGAAKIVNCPFLVLSQLSRAVESRDDKRPLLSDLRESGAIEQDADVVIFVYRDEYYLQRQRPKDNASSNEMADYQAALDRSRNQADLIVAKQRLGPIGSVTLNYDPPTGLFSTPDYDDDQADFEIPI